MHLKCCVGIALQLRVGRGLHVRGVVSLTWCVWARLLVFVRETVDDWCVSGIVLFHTVPFIYDKYEDVIDHHARKASELANHHYKNFDAAVLSKVPRAPAKQKKF